MDPRHPFPEQCEAEVIAGFGGAHLMKDLEGKLELVGGSREGREAGVHDQRNETMKQLGRMLQPFD